MSQSTPAQHHPPSSSVLAKQDPLAIRELEGSSLFRGVELPPLWPLLEGCQTHQLQPGDELIRVGDRDSRLFVVLAGTLRVHLGSAEDEAVANLGPGDSVGEIAALDRKPRSAGVVAETPARLLAIDMEDFWLLLGRSHQLSLNLLNILSERLRGNNAAILESRRLQEQYKQHATMDPLTGLFNRRGLEDLGARLIRRLSMSDSTMSLMMVDIDHFKRFNDEFGHQAGDYVLSVVAQVLKNQLRPTDVVARYGGEELTVLLPDTRLDGARVAAERVRSKIEHTSTKMPDGTELPAVTVSIGIAEIAPEQTLAPLMEKADAALYEAKRGGRNQVRLAE